MAAERKTVRVFADVVPGFDPLMTVWNGPSQMQYHTAPPPNSRRLWFDIEIPADHEIWPEQYNAGVNIGNLLNPPSRRLILDENENRPAPEAPRATRRMPRAEIRDSSESPEI